MAGDARQGRAREGERHNEKEGGGEGGREAERESKWWAKGAPQSSLCHGGLRGKHIAEVSQVTPVSLSEEAI